MGKLACTQYPAAARNVTCAHVKAVLCVQVITHMWCPECHLHAYLYIGRHSMLACAYR